MTILRVLAMSALFVAVATSSIFSQVMAVGELSGRYTAPEPLTALNSDADDFGPRYDVLAATVLFASERSGEAMLYQAPAALDQAPHRAQGTMNADGKHRAYVTFSNAGDGVGAAYVMRRRRSWVGIITVLRDGAAYNAGLPIEALNGEWFTSHPTISPDGTRIVVCSDREGTERGLDLYISERLPGGEWRAPTSLGTAITSQADDITPVFIGNDSLLFASNGFGGKGGFDLFLTVYRDGAWQEPEPLDWLNTEFDEMDAVRLPDGTIVFASDRPGGRGGLDLYRSRPR